jgi:spermidine synthase
MEFVNSSIPQPNPVTTTVMLGVATVISQALLLREAMAAMGGSETAWGLVMALWLAGMGFGSRLGVRLGTFRLAVPLPAISLGLAAIGVLLFRAAPALLGTAPGETITTWHAVWLWALAVVPAAAAGGFCFPILAGELGSRGPGRAYTLEALGALLGGTMLSMALTTLGTGSAFVIAIGLTAGATLWPRLRLFAALLMLGSMTAAVPAGETLARATWRWAGHPGPLGDWAETSQQRLEVSTGPPMALYTDGRLAASYPDPYVTLPRAHLMLLLHPAPRRVLAVGCTADGSIEAMVRHPVNELVLVDEDPQLARRLDDWYPGDFRTIMSNPKVTARSTDPLRAIGSTGDLDLVILADGDPISLRANRTRTVEFLQSCRRAMTKDGVLIMRVGVGDTYLGGVAGDLLATLTSTLKEVFPQVTAIPGEAVLLVASVSEAPLDTSIETLVSRRLDRPEIGDQLHPALLTVLLDQDRHTDLAAFIDTADPAPNTLRHPRAVPIAARLHESRSQPVLVSSLAGLGDRLPKMIGAAAAVVTICLIILALAGGGAIRATAAASVIGFTSMGWWMLLMATWQATRGSVYAEVGALTGVFMAGVAVGGWASHRSGRQAQLVPWVFGAGAGLSLALASGLSDRVPLAFVPVLLVIGGILTGAAFPGLGEFASRGSGRRGAGLAFAADEIGAAAAALVIGTIAIPSIGMTATAVGLAVLGSAAIPAVVRS